MTRFIDRAIVRLSGINPWHFIWITTLLAEVFTLIANTAQSLIWWGFISADLLLIGTIDAFFVSLLVAPLIIYFVKFATRLNVEKEMYEMQIIDLRKMEEELRKAKNEWEESFDIINDAITIHDAAFNIIRANKAAEAMMGLPFPMISKQKCYESYHGTDCPPEGCPSCETLKTGLPSTSELYEPHLKKYLEIKALPRLDSGGRVTGLIHVVRDITDRIKAEGDARRTAEMTRDILEKSPFGIYVINSRGTIEYVNPSMLAISGDKPIHFIGLNVFELPTYRELGLSEKLLKAFDGEAFSLGPVEYTSYYGKKKTTRKFIGVPFGGGADRKVIIFVEDVTSLKKAEGEQKRLQQQLVQAQKMESVGRLAGGIAHDFNNILSAIIGYSDMAVHSLPQDHPVREYCSIILEAGEKAASLTQQLLAFSRKQVLEMKVISVNSVIVNMMKILNHAIGESIELTCVTRSPIRNVLADPGQMEQVLMNLVINARDAMPTGGRITIETADASVDDAEASRRKGFRAGTYVTIKVSDTGIGMSQETKEKVFEPFFTTKEQGKGTGLGLATVYGIVKQHDGYIAVDSAEQQGTTFTVFIPVVDAEAETAEDVKPLTMPKGVETILVVEDDEVVRNMIVDVIRSFGYRVFEAADGKDALQQFSGLAEKPSLLLTDVVMPVMGGVELARAVRSDHPEIRVIFMSGYSGDAIADGIMQEPGVAFIQKPLTPAKLAVKFRELLQK